MENIKKIEAPNLAQAYEIVKKEYGEQAKIISTRKVLSKNGIMGKTSVEVSVLIGSASASKASQKIQNWSHIETNRPAYQIRGLGDEFVKQKENVSYWMQKYQRVLKKNNVASKLSKNIFLEIERVLYKANTVTHHDFLMRFKNIMASKIRICRPYADRLRVPNTPRVAFFVGPSGAGKTLSLVKLAAQLKFFSKQKVVLVQSDYFKLTAKNELQPFSQIIKCPHEFCAEAKSIRALVEQYGDDYVFLVDTVGCSFNEQNKFKELFNLVSSLRSEVFLCHSANTQQDVTSANFEMYSKLKPKSAIWTKVDEIVTAGTILNTAWRSQLAISYWSCGPNVPEDFSKASREWLVDSIINPKWNCGGDR